MGKHEDPRTSRQAVDYQPKHGSKGGKSATDAPRIVGRLKSERAAGK